MIIPNLFETKFSELQTKGAECIADIDHVDMLIAQRHMYLQIAKDLKHPDEKLMAHAYCELAEKIQDLLDFWEIEMSNKNIALGLLASKVDRGEITLDLALERTYILGSKNKDEDPITVRNPYPKIQQPLTLEDPFK